MAEASDFQCCAISLGWTPEFPEYPGNEAHDVKALCCLKAPRYTPDEKSRATLDLVAVIDTSGSMSGQPLEQVKTSLLFMIDKCNSAARSSIITNVPFVLLCSVR